MTEVKTVQGVEQLISDFLEITHKNYAQKSLQYSNFLKESLKAPKEVCAVLNDLIVSTSACKTVFLFVMTHCLLQGNTSSTRSAIDIYHKKFGSAYLVALELNLRLFLSNVASRRANNSLSSVADAKHVLIKNTKECLNWIKRKNSDENVLGNFFQNVFSIGKKNKQSPLTIGFVVDDLNPQKTATLTKMMFDIAAVLLQHTLHNVVMVISKLHAPNNEFWFPCVHQTRVIPFDEYTSHYEIDINSYRERLSIIYLNELLYKKKPVSPIEIDVFLTFPARHQSLEPELFKLAPVVEVEILVGMSSASNCDIVVPNGIPGDSFLKENIAKIVLIQAPRRRFKGGHDSSFDYLQGLQKFIVTISKDFDKRIELNTIDHFMSYVGSFLNKCSDISWVFVGGSKDFEAMLSSRYAPFVNSKRIIAINFESDLPGLLQKTYLYVHPPIIGGGRVPSIAIENGCPVVTFEFGDCIKYVPHWCQFHDFDDLFEEIQKIVGSSSKRDALLESCLIAVSPSVNIECAINYEAALRRAIVKYNERCGYK